jgi:phenylacetate-CoA ligase
VPPPSKRARLHEMSAHLLELPTERFTVAELRVLQSSRLRHVIESAADRVPHYRAAFAAAAVQPRNLERLADLERFPFTTKDDLRRHYPFGLLAVPMHEVVRVHASSGTTGKPTVVAYTQGDIDLWAELMARSIRAAGGKRGDKLHNAYGYGLLTGGLGFHYGAERAGCTVIPVGGGFTERQVQLMRCGAVEREHAYGDRESLGRASRERVRPVGSDRARCRPGVFR